MTNQRIDALSPGMFELDGQDVEFAPGDTILQAATRAGHYIPHLCWKPEFAPHGSCRLCTVKVNGRSGAACTVAASAGQEVQSNTDELNAQRKTLLQMLFVEGNHFCPSCEKSGNCLLQATAYEVGMEGPHFEECTPADRSTPVTPMYCSTSTVVSCAACVCVPAPAWTASTSLRLTVMASRPIWWSTAPAD